MKKLSFVVHKHDATSLHYNSSKARISSSAYDFRLEIHGVMPSWAIPKGPTLDPSVKRLAMETTDHSLDYKDFEGIISKACDNEVVFEEGHYGAGPVMVWDAGTYIPEVEVSKGVRKEVKGEEGEKVMEEGLKKGEIKFFLEGKKLRGSFALVKTKGFPPGVKNAWLLIKHKDEYTQEGYDAKDFDFSAKTGKKMKEIQ